MQRRSPIDSISTIQVMRMQARKYFAAQEQQSESKIKTKAARKPSREPS